ncbi:MAG: peptide deformylase [Spartobacteria bacterium]|nr:peptide deformylase [Spartobacteria bacterium]
MTNNIRIYGDPVLRQKAVAVEEVTNEIRAMVDQMLKDMYAENGLGLAAEQVGRTEAVCIVDVPKDLDVDGNGVENNPDVTMPVVLINPEIISASEKFESREEGCLSFPGIYAAVSRPGEVLVRYLDREGKVCELKARALLARAIQHEMDHLNGILLVDRMSQVKRVAMSGRLKRLKKNARRVQL